MPPSAHSFNTISFIICLGLKKGNLAKLFIYSLHTEVWRKKASVKFPASLSIRHNVNDKLAYMGPLCPIIFCLWSAFIFE
jgi:hypothetical protein